MIIFWNTKRAASVGEFTDLDESDVRAGLDYVANGVSKTGTLESSVTYSVLENATLSAPLFEARLLES